MAIDMEGLKEAARFLGVDLIERCGSGFEDRARAEAPVASGAGAESIRVTDQSQLGDRLSLTVVCDALSADGFPYMTVQNTGTGPIEGNPLLVFEGDDGLVFAQGTKGVPATHFWDNAIEAWPSIVAEAQG